MKKVRRKSIDVNIAGILDDDLLMKNEEGTRMQDKFLPDGRELPSVNRVEFKCFFDDAPLSHRATINISYAWASIFEGARITVIQVNIRLYIIL